MIEVRQSIVFEAWIADLKDVQAKARIAARIIRLRNGLFGDVKFVGGSVAELRIDHGPGYRLYFTRRGSEVILLLCGGSKKSQQRDIEQAKIIAKELDL